MIKPLKDKDGNYIPLDTAILYKDNGDAVAVIGYYYVIPLNVWAALTSHEETIYPCDFHLNEPSVDVIVEKFWRHMGDCFDELKERCK